LPNRQKSTLKFFYESLAIGSIAPAKAFLDFTQPATFEFMRQSHTGVATGCAAKFFSAWHEESGGTAETKAKSVRSARQLELGTAPRRTVSEKTNSPQSAAAQVI
jgi:hypothetical protein